MQTQQDRQTGPIIKTLRSQFSAQFTRDCVLTGETQRCALSFYHGAEMKIIRYLKQKLTHNYGLQS